VTASVERSATTPWPGLLEKLMGVVRAEFRVDLYVPAPDHPVLGRGTCPVSGCDRSPTGNGLCSTHQKRWLERGRPELAAFLTDPGAPVNGRRDLTGCTVPGCRYGSSGLGLCMRHRSSWTISGHPDPITWAATAPAADPAGRTICGLPFCSLWIESERNLFCKAHETRWRMQGRPEVEEFIARCLLAGRDRIDFSGLPPQLKLELQYAVQCRADQATITLPPPVVAWTIRRAGEAEVTPLLDHPAQWWADRAGPKTSSYPAFLAFTRDVVETLHEGTGWEVEYPREVWRLERLPGLTGNAGKTHARNRLRFDQITQPWLRVLVKRWSRLRLSSGMAVGTVVSDVKALRRFSEFLTAAAPEVEALADVDRALLERYLAWLVTAGLGHGAREDAVTCLGTFFQALRQHNWDPSLPTTAVFFAGDLPSRPSRLTRHLAEHVMAQVEAPTNLDRWPNPEGRLVTLILIQCGLRATDACTLSFDCLLHDGQGAPYLRYFNNKMRREAAVPIDADLEAEIGAQQQRVAGRWPQQHPHLFPQLKGNVGGRRPLSYYSYRGHAQLLAGALRGPRRARPAGSSDPAPVASHVRLSSDQPRRPSGGHPGPARSPVDADDCALRPDHRPDRSAALGAGHQGQHQGRADRHRPGRTSGPGAVGQDPLRDGHPDPAARILRPAGAEELSTRQRLPDLPGVLDRAGVPSRAA